jgi:hypothetical protein
MRQDRASNVLAGPASFIFLSLARPVRADAADIYVRLFQRLELQVAVSGVVAAGVEHVAGLVVGPYLDHFDDHPPVRINSSARRCDADAVVGLDHPTMRRDVPLDVVDVEVVVVGAAVNRYGRQHVEDVPKGLGLRGERGRLASRADVGAGAAIENLELGHVTNSWRARFGSQAALDGILSCFRGHDPILKI